jgi:tRNA-specific 2-thiouridylase
VVVGPRAALARRQIRVGNGRLFVPVGRVGAKLRYRSPAIAATVEDERNGFSIALDQPVYGVAPGQAAVLYEGEVVVGAGLITAAH